MASEARARSARSVEVVRTELRDAIVSGRLPQGAVLSQVSLSEQFGVSRTPLREALRMLQSEGFIRSVPNQRVRVSEVSVADLEQLYTMRLTLEAVAIRLSVPQLTEGDIGDLHELLTTMESYRAARNVEAWHAPHREFHRRLIAYAGDAITEVVASLQDKADRYRHIYITSEPLAWSATGSEHEAIVAACERRDASAAGDLLARHLARTALTLVALMDPHHEPVPIRTVLSLMVESATPEAVTTRGTGAPVASTGAGSTSGGPENGGGAE